jgi:hypothetical protein
MVNAKEKKFLLERKPREIMRRVVQKAYVI